MITLIRLSETLDQRFSSKIFFFFFESNVRDLRELTRPSNFPVIIL